MCLHLLAKKELNTFLLSRLVVIAVALFLAGCNSLHMTSTTHTKDKADVDLSEAATDDSLFPKHMELWIHDTLGIHKAWQVSIGRDVFVAVIDSGVNKVKGLEKVEPGYNSIDGGSNTDDTIGHGTFVASIIGTNYSNEPNSYLGLAPGVRIIPIKAFSEEVSEDENLKNVAQGIKWAVDHNARIINVSLGFSSDSQMLRDAIAYAYNKGVVIVAASGNYGEKELLFPAANPMVIPIAASSKQGGLLPNTNYNQDCIVSPGENIPGLSKDGAIISGSGTSAAVPVVSGIIALAKSANPNLTVPQLKVLLKQSNLQGTIDVPTFLAYALKLKN